MFSTEYVVQVSHRTSNNFSFTKWYIWWINMRRCVTAAQQKEVDKQPSRGVLKKRYSENMQQIYRRTRMSKCDFNKVKQLYWNHTSAWRFSSKFAGYFQNTLCLWTPLGGCFWVIFLNRLLECFLQYFSFKGGNQNYDGNFM